MYGFRGEYHREFDHEQLHKMLNHRKSKWIMTYNSHPTILSDYKKFHIQEIPHELGFENKKRKSEVSSKGHILIYN